MAQHVIAAIMLFGFGCAVIGYACGRRESREILITPGEPKDDLERRWRQVQR